MGGDPPNENAGPKRPEQQDTGSRTQVKVAVIGLAGLLLAAVIAGGFGSVNALIAKEDKPSPSASISTSPPIASSASASDCRKPDGKPITDKFTAASYPGVNLKWVSYTVTYGSEGDAAYAYLEVTGQIVGSLPPGYRLYRFGWADPSTTDSTREHHSGTGRYLWDAANPIYPDPSGCWEQGRRILGYSAAQGITFRHYYGLVSETDRPCLDRLRAADKNGDGFYENALSGCGVAFLGHITIPTKPLG
jgi:hypothetical protein